MGSIIGTDNNYHKNLAPDSSIVDRIWLSLRF